MIKSDSFQEVDIFLPGVAISLCLVKIHQAIIVVAFGIIDDTGQIVWLRFFRI